MPHISQKGRDILGALGALDIFSELTEQEENGHYRHVLDLDLIAYGRGYAGGPVGPYARRLHYSAGEELIRADEWAGSGEDEWERNSFYVLVRGRLKAEFAPDAAARNGDDAKQCAEAEHCVEYAQPGKVIGAELLLEGAASRATVSVPEGAHAVVLQLKRPALRLLRKYPKFAAVFDKNYRDYGRNAVLRVVDEAPSARDDRELWRRLSDLAAFEVYDDKHVLFRERQPVSNVYLIHSGWVELARGREGAPDSLHHLGPGNCLGLEALGEKPTTEWAYTATLRARTALLVVPVEKLRGRPDLAAAVRRVFSAFSEADEEATRRPEAEPVVKARRKEIESGLADGANLLVMDMALCVRCGNCSMACHQVHGQSRLVRRGIHIERPRRGADASRQSVLAPQVCLHCQDPECLTGCPTGAIGRYEDRRVDINAETCIGCGDCATQCPYNAITLVPAPPPARDPKRRTREELERGLAKRLLAAAGGYGAKVKGKAGGLVRAFDPRPARRPVGIDTDKVKAYLAVKCNLCHGTPLNPPGATRQAYSCEENCPTGALVRVNPREYFDEAGRGVGGIYADQTRAIGRNIHKRDTPARVVHFAGALATLAAALVAGWAAYRYGLDARLTGAGWSVRWLTGVAGGVFLLFTLLYLARKQIYRRRAGALRYWLLAHVYSGLIAAIIFQLHGGWRAGGWLTAALIISFNLTLLTGAFGALCYYFVPRLLTRIEETPLLVEDLERRRDELREKLLELRDSDRGDEELRRLAEGRVRERFFTPGYLWRQYRRREPLTDMLAGAREDFKAVAKELGLSRETREALIEAVETAATLRRVEALLYLHWLLKLWLAPHVLFTTLMLALLAGHVYQVFHYAVR